MDETEVAYGLPALTVPGLIAMATVLGGFAFTTDVSGGIAGGVLAAAALACAGWASRGPTIRADRSGLRVRGALVTRRLTWPDVRSIRANYQRRGRGLEFETSQGLLFVPAFLLGRHATAEVYDTISALWELHRLDRAPQPG